ncbi:MAG: hypothetical protein IT427_02130 [Pirellulales bacterium]|nr:hypothetical protein [Pirellulales bacterium]
MRPRSLFTALIYLAICDALHAVEFGWQALPEGGLEYLVRIEPGLLDSVHEISSELPREAPEFRQIKIVVSAEKLPNEGTLPPQSDSPKREFAASEAMPSTPANARTFAVGWQELPGGSIEYIVRVEPAQLASFHEAVVRLPNNTPAARRVRVVASAEKLPGEGTLPQSIDQNERKPSGGDSTAPLPDMAPNRPDVAPPATINVPSAYTDSPPAAPINPISAAMRGTSSLPWSQANREPNEQSTPPAPVAADRTQVPHLDANSLPGGKSYALKVETPESRPWLPLMAALVALFASLGVNVYLAWIHQSLRANYRSLAASNRGESTTA